MVLLDIFFSFKVFSKHNFVTLAHKITEMGFKMAKAVFPEHLMAKTCFVSKNYLKLSVWMFIKRIIDTLDIKTESVQYCQPFNY